MSSDESAAKDYYAILGLNFDASIDEIRSAYKRLAFSLHPDRHDDPATQLRLQEIVQAYATLSNSEKRAEYDARFYDDEPVIVTESLADQGVFDVGIAYDAIAASLPSTAKYSPRSVYLAHLAKAKRRKRIAEVAFTILLVLILILFGFHPLTSSSGPVFTQTQSSSSSSTTGGGTTIINKSGIDQQLLVVQGAQGPQGLAGSAGPAGIRGLDGRIGVDGKAGPAGPAGANGAPGVAGPAGPAGATGPAGPAGAAGSNGTNGSNGRDATVYTVRPNLGVGNGSVIACTDAIDTNTYGTNPVSLDITLKVAYNPTTQGYTLSKINVANIPKPCMNDYIQLNIQLSSPWNDPSIPHTLHATAGAHFNCQMANPLSAADFDSGTATYGKYSFVAGPTHECATDLAVGGVHSLFVDASNNPLDGVDLDLSTVYATDLEHISIVVNS